MSYFIWFAIACGLLAIYLLTPPKRKEPVYVIYVGPTVHMQGRVYLYMYSVNGRATIMGLTNGEPDAMKIYIGIPEEHLV